MNNSEYWARRIRIASDAVENRVIEDYVKNLEEVYTAVIADVEKDMRSWYQRFAKNNKIEYADAQRLLKSDELAEFKWDVKQYIKYGKEHAINGSWEKELENASARVHISRLESIEIGLRQHAEALGAMRIENTYKAAEYAFTESYNRTAFEIQKGLGVGWSMQGIDTRKLEKLLDKPWTSDDMTFTARCWKDKKALVDTINTSLTRMIATGDSPERAIKEISERFRVSKYNAGRLVMTESAYFSSAAQKECFNELGVERYEIVGTFDKHMCPICGRFNGKVLDMKEFKEGITAPPFHPNCRCCTAPYFEELEDVGRRFARDVKTGKAYTVPGNTTYEQWKQMQNEKHGADVVDKSRKMAYNDSADRELFEHYKDLLGKNAPKNFAEFQEIKYSVEWESFKAYSRAINTGELTPLADFELYKAISKEIDEKIVGIVTSNNIKITGKSYHCIARTIGSIEQKRNGVQVSDILDALTSKEAEILPVKESNNGRSQKFRNKAVEVSVNPDTGNIIQVNPVHTGRKKAKS